MVLRCRETFKHHSSTRNIYELSGQVPQSKITGQQTDISSLTTFGWYEWVYYRDPGQSYPMPSERLVRCLGPSEHAGTAMNQWVLNEQGNAPPQQTLCRLTREEILSNTELSKRKSYNDAIRANLDDSMNPPPIPLDIDEENFTPEESTKSQMRTTSLNMINTSIPR